MHSFFFAIIALVVISVLIYGWYAADQRRKELFAWAQSRNLSFSPQKDYGFDSRYANFSWGL